MIRLFAVTFIVLFIACSNIDKNPTSETSVGIELNNSLQAEIKNLIIKEVKNSVSENDIPALSVAIIQDGNILLKEGFGMLKRKSNQLVDPNTMYQVASLSKMLTGIIANSLIQEKLINPEDPITSYFKRSVSSAAVDKLKDVKIKHLLMHTSGIPYNSIVLNRIDGEPMEVGYTEKQILADLEQLKLEFQAGEKYGYSNLGYGILGYILESASGLTYSELLQKYVAEPYNLKNTVVHSTAELQANLATPYRKDNRAIETKPWTTGKLTPASGIYSNVIDLSKLMAQQIRAYRTNKDEKQDSPLILTRIKATRGNEGSFYGMGIFEDNSKRGIIYGHRGDMDGFASEYTFNPERNVGVVVLTSSGGRWAGLLAARIMKHLEENALHN